MPHPHARKRARVRGFEREQRIEQLIAAGLIETPGAIPGDAIPATVEAARASRRGKRLFYRDLPYRCRDCGTEAIWTAEEQRFWYETVHGSPRGTATRCAVCRKKGK